MRELDPNRRTIIRPNRDTLNSGAVFDLDAGPVTILLPDAGNRYMSMEVIDEDHFIQAVVYGAGGHTFTKEKVRTRYTWTLVRTFVDPTDPKDFEEVHALQDASKVSRDSPGRFEVPNWDQTSRKKVHDALLVLGETVPDTKRMFGNRAEVDPVRHLIGTACCFGGNPERDALYLTLTPDKNDGATIHWSVSVYNAEGYSQPNEHNAYSFNNITAAKSADGSVTIQFGGCDGKIANCLPILPRWNYTVRLNRPRAEILEGKWTFPQAEPIN